MARPRQTTDNAILTIARTCFLEHGPSVSTTVIAEAAGVSQATLFKRFGTKDDLLLKALAPASDVPWLALVQAGPDDRPAREQLVEIAHSIFVFFQHLIPNLAVLKSAGFSPKDLLARYEEPPPLRGRRLLAGWLIRAGDRGL